MTTNTLKFKPKPPPTVQDFLEQGDELAEIAKELHTAITEGRDLMADPDLYDLVQSLAGEAGIWQAMRKRQVPAKAA